jgi:hypothetical protein
VGAVLSELKIEPISYNATKPFLLGIHYAKRMPSISFAFGLYDDGILEGVVTYGTPPSAPLRSGICGPDFSNKILELNRLCLRNNIKGHASRLVGRSIKMIGKDAIIVSFADTSQGHVGIVYQSTNFLYCGLSAKRTDWKVKGKEHLHGQTIADEFRGVKNRADAMREKYGDDFYLSPRPRKHRYIYISGGKKFRRKSISSLRYDIFPYPKAEGMK